MWWDKKKKEAINSCGYENIEQAIQICTEQQKLEDFKNSIKSEDIELLESFIHPLHYATQYSKMMYKGNKYSYRVYIEYFSSVDCGDDISDRYGSISINDKEVQDNDLIKYVLELIKIAECMRRLEKIESNKKQVIRDKELLKELIGS